MVMIDATRHLATDFAIPIAVNITFWPMLIAIVVGPALAAVGLARFLWWRVTR